MATRRRLARHIAVQALYEVDAVEHDPYGVVVRWAAESKASEGTTAFARELVTGVLQEREELDTLLQGSAPLYPVSGIAPVDRAVLRLALYELLHVPATPPKRSRPPVEFAPATRPVFCAVVPSGIQQGLPLTT